MSKRSPRAHEVVLQHRTIYVFPSKQGLVFLILILLIWLLGTNYQNNLILGLSFLLTSIMLVSVIHAFRNLLGLKFTPAAIQHSVMGEVAAFDIEISSSYLRHHHGLMLQAADEFEPVRADINAGTTVVIRLNAFARHRGWLKLPRIILKTYFPLGLIRAWAYIDLDHRALVFPKAIASDLPPLGIGQGEEGKFVSQQSGTEFQGFQKYYAGAPLAQIAWKHFARGTGLHLKDYRALQSEHFWLDWQAIHVSNTELALSNLCYWVNYFSENNLDFGLRLPHVVIAVGGGDVQRLNALTALALFGWVQEHENV